MIKTAECTGVSARLNVLRRKPVLTARESSRGWRPMEIAAVAADIAAIDECSAVRNVSVVVIHDCVVVPVESPVMPSPTEAAEQTDPKPYTESNRRAADENAGNRIPSGPHRERRAVHEPRIVCGHIHHIWIGWFNYDRLPLGCYFLL